jgi:hypothetical protein
VRSGSLPKEALAAGADLNARVALYMQQQRAASESPSLMQPHGSAESARSGQPGPGSATAEAAPGHAAMSPGGATVLQGDRPFQVPSAGAPL